MEVARTFAELGLSHVEAITTVVAEDARGVLSSSRTIEGWYEGNAERMEQALHPDLAKRIVGTNQQNHRSRLDLWEHGFRQARCL
jgi:hypothetical protein